MKNTRCLFLLLTHILFVVFAAPALAERVNTEVFECRRNCDPAPSIAPQLSDADKARVTSLSDQRQCHIRLAQPFASYAKTFETWFTNENSKFNLRKNFRDFQTKNDTKFAEIEKFASTANVVPDSIQGLSDVLKARDSAYFALTSSIKRMNSSDETFLHSLNNLEAGLATLQQQLTVDTNGCHPSTVSKMTQAQQEVTRWISTLQRMRAFVTITMRKRSTTAAISYISSKLQIKQAYAQRTLIALNDLENQINQIFEASSLLDEESIWYGNAMILQGAGRGWAGQKLAYELALETLKADFVLGSRIQSKIASARITDEQKAFVGGEVSFHLKTIQSMIGEIEAGGWQKRFVSQKAITEKIISLGSRYPEKCRQAAVQCASSQALVSDLATYRHAEKLYFSVFDSCFARE